MKLEIKNKYKISIKNKTTYLTPYFNLYKIKDSNNYHQEIEINHTS
jgi:hypothetical protein